MKKRLLTLALVAATCAAAHSQSLIVNKASTGEVSYPLSSLQHITFAAGSMHILQKDGTVASHIIGDISEVFFGEAGAIEQTPAEGESLICFAAPDELRINTAHEAQVALYSVEGRQLLRERCPGGGTLSIAQLPKGVYILRINNQTVKIARR